jgi:hypothetical protein
VSLKIPRSKQSVFWQLMDRASEKGRELYPEVSRGPQNYLYCTYVLDGVRMSIAEIARALGFTKIGSDSIEVNR